MNYYSLNKQSPIVAAFVGVFTNKKIIMITKMYNELL
jgi:hypothetical protein